MGSDSSAAAISSAGAAPTAVITGAEERATGNSPEALTFDLLQNAAYHSDRLAHFSGLHRLVSFVTVLLGTGAVVGALGKAPTVSVISGVLVAFASSLDLALDLRGQARLHERLRERIFDLMADMEEAGDNPRDLLVIRAALVRSFGEETADMCVVNAMAHNAAVQATQRSVDLDDLIPLTRAQRFLRHWLRQPGEYLTLREVKQRKAKLGGHHAASPSSG